MKFTIGAKGYLATIVIKFHWAWRCFYPVRVRRLPLVCIMQLCAFMLCRVVIKILFLNRRYLFNRRDNAWEVENERSLCLSLLTSITSRSVSWVSFTDYNRIVLLSIIYKSASSNIQMWIAAFQETIFNPLSELKTITFTNIYFA